MIHFYLFSILFILFTSIIYFKYGKEIKQLQDYIALNQSIGAGPLAIAIITITIAGAALQTTILNIQVKGISSPITRILFYSITPLAFAHYVFPKLLKFENTYSLSGVISKMYGSVAGTVTSIIASTICFSIAYNQLITLLPIMEVFSNSRFIFLILVGCIATWQALWLSNNRISTISILQFILITTLLFSLATIVLSLEEVAAQGGGLQGLFQAIKKDNRVQQSILGYRPSWGMILNILQLPSAFLFPPLIQRFLIAKDQQQMKRALGGFAFFHIFFGFIIIIIGLGSILISLKKYGQTTTNLKELVHCLPNNPWLGLSYSYLILISSTGIISYFLHSLSIELTENVIKKLIHEKKLNNDNSYVKNIICITGPLVILFTLICPKIHPGLLTFLMIFMQAILAPFMIGCTGIKGTHITFFTGVISFYITILLLLWINQYGYFPIKEGLSLDNILKRLVPFALIISGLGVLVSHLLTYGKIQMREKKKKSFMIKRKQKESFRVMFSNPLAWAKEKMEKYDSNPTAISAFLLIMLALPTLTGNSSTPQYNGKILFLVRITGIVLTTLVMFHNLFPYFLKKIFPLIWFFTLAYTIPFASTFIMLCSHYNFILIVKLGLLFITLRLLTDWRTTLFLICTGGVAAYGLYVTIMPSSTAFISLQAKWDIFEFSGLTTILLLILITYHEKVSANYVKRNKTLASGFSHDLNNLFQYLTWMVGHKFNNESIEKILELLKKDPDQIKKNAKILQNLITTTDAVKKYLIECLHESRAFYDLIQSESINSEDIKEVEIGSFLKETYFFVPINLQEKVKINVKTPAKLLTHPAILRSILLNLIKNSFKHAKPTEVVIGWDHEKEALYVKDNGTGIPSEQQSSIFELYYTTGGSGVGLPFIKVMIERMSGSIYFKTSPQGTTFFVELPIA